MSELHDFFPSRRAFAGTSIGDGAHAPATAAVGAATGHAAFVCDSAVVVAHTHPERCAAALAVAAGVPRTARLAAQHAATVGAPTAVEQRLRDDAARVYRAAAWAPGGLRAAGRAAAPLLAVCGGPGLDARVLRAPPLAPGRTPAWPVVAVPSEALWAHHQPRWAAAAAAAAAEREAAAAAAADTPTYAPKRRRRANSAAAGSGNGTAAAAVAAVAAAVEEGEGSEEDTDEIEAAGQAFLARLGCAPPAAPAAAEEGSTETEDWGVMDTEAVARARAVVPVAAAWSDVVAGRALLAVASRRSVALASFASAEEGGPESEDGAVHAVIDIDDDDDDITCVAFSHDDPPRLEDLVLAVGTARGRVRLYRFGEGSTPTLAATLCPDATAGGPTLVAAALVVARTLVFVRGTRVVAASLDDPARSSTSSTSSSTSTVALGAIGTSLAHSSATHCIYAGVADGTVKVLSLQHASAAAAPRLTHTGELCCRGAVRGVACSPSGALLFCHVRPRDRPTTAVAVYSLLPPPTAATPAPALLLDLLAKSAHTSAAAAADGVSLVLARCTQADLHAVLATAPLLPPAAPLRHVVLCKARALLFADVAAPLAACAQARALAHARRFVTAAAAATAAAATAAAATAGAATPFTDVERESLAAHAAFLLAHDAADAAALRVRALVGDAREVCPVCGGALDRGAPDDAEDGTQRTGACAGGHGFARCAVTRLCITPGMLVRDGTLRHCGCCGRAVWLPHDASLFAWHPQWLCPYCDAVTL